MIAIEMKFAAGKFHATPWGRQVNEGAVEWPPSPWRLLRSLLAIWHHKMPDVSQDEMSALIEKLSALPSFVLPPSSPAHTRHYMPTHGNPVKVFDAFLAVPKSKPLIVGWPEVELTDDQQALLRRLVEAMTYFGRAESWVEATVTGQVDQPFDAVPMEPNDLNRHDRLERLLAAEESQTFQSWRDEAIGQREAATLLDKQQKAAAKGKSIEKLRLTKKDLARIDESIPTTILQGLHAETTPLRKAGWNRPPGSRWVQYGCIDRSQSRIVVNRHRFRQPRSSSVARYAVTGKVVPRIFDAIRIGERARKFVMGCSKRANAEAGFAVDASAVFSGKNDQGQPLGGAHQHAHFLCEACGPDDRITHLNIVAPMGFSSDDELALSWFNRTFGDQKHDLQFVLLGIGTPGDFGGTNRKIGQSPMLAKSRVWQSSTPLVLNRHLKVKAAERDDPAKLLAAQEREIEAAVRRELEYRDWLQQDQLVKVEAMPQSRSNRRWLEFKRDRQSGGGRQASNMGYGLKLIFDKPQAGPIAIGFGCHFGLGNFEAID